MLLGTEESYWLHTAPGPTYPTLEADVEADVAVLGAGIAGISVAWELAAAGYRVVLLESDRIAAGVTGHTTAKLSSLHTLLYGKLRGAFGAEAAALYARSQQDAVERVAAVSAELGIDCDLERVPGYTFVEGVDQLDDIGDEVVAASEAGLPATYVSETGLPFRVAGAVRVEDQAQFHPRTYLLGLAEDLVRRGGRIFEHSRAVDLTEGDPCRVTTENGSVVTAGHVVVATHYPVFDRAMLFTRLDPVREVVVAAAIPAADDPGGIYITPEQNTRSVRTAPYDDGRRLLIVTGEHFTPGTAEQGEVAERYERLIAWTREKFPAAEVLYRWATQDNSTTDQLPFVGPFHPGARNVYVAAGFGGWGMSNGVMAGRLLAATIAGQTLPWTDLYDPRRLHLRQEAGPLATLQGTVARHFVGDRLRRSDVDSVEEIAPGAGAVLKVEGKRCAVYRDDAGALHAVSARCTHLGCLVHFNDTEVAWECPCHGSRFAVDGAVLQGPANRPLDRVELDPPAG
ncbi:FAD-dependent oxidoreductase [Cellulomonas fimi]|uniref:FAD-dependent oxidoreductase n=1 Tax=Cellulomonas fimi TaxID=1708 RepID=A0A7Y0LVM3_CELFI|nr:FAD-dependent oxidoreductase [Cellulomonas fimi]NMR19062.1 FAD-dependent oxidoreductase [Cellulomonas fimi]